MDERKQITIYTNGCQTNPGRMSCSSQQHRRVATHMETLDHATVTRKALRQYAEANGIRAAKLRIPLDGEKINFLKS